MAVAVMTRKNTFSEAITEPVVEVKKSCNYADEVIAEDDPFFVYKWTVICFTMFIGILHKYLKMKEQGLSFDQTYYQKVIETIDCKGKQLLQIKEELGLEGKLDFLGNNKFDGFEIRDGVFIGETDNVITITSPWIEQFNPENCYLYEVAHYIQYLAFPENLYCGEEIGCQEEPEMVSSETVEKLSLWDRVKGGIKLWQKKRFSLKLSA